MLLATFRDTMATRRRRNRVISGDGAAIGGARAVTGADNPARSGYLVPSAARDAGARRPVPVWPGPQVPLL